MALSQQNVNPMMLTQVQTEQGSQLNGDASSAEAPGLLLAEVDFKWLMAGQGWWINLQRFHCDPSYAAGLLRSALASPCGALRDCAALLQAQLGGPASHVT